MIHAVEHELVGISRKPTCLNKRSFYDTSANTTALNALCAVLATLQIQAALGERAPALLADGGVERCQDPVLGGLLQALPPRRAKVGSQGKCPARDTKSMSWSAPRAARGVQPDLEQGCRTRRNGDLITAKVKRLKIEFLFFQIRVAEQSASCQAKSAR
jgi:hypothetical protein